MVFCSNDWLACISADFLLKSLCLEDNTKQAKDAEKAVAATIKDSGLQALSALYKVLCVRCLLFMHLTFLHLVKIHRHVVICFLILSSSLSTIKNDSCYSINNQLTCRGLLLCWRMKNIYQRYCNCSVALPRLQCQFLRLKKRE